tara:strand:+ start:121212 stop:121808 length:597 start_codon:yes stop_codon:yes gene_type:complete
MLISLYIDCLNITFTAKAERLTNYGALLVNWLFRVDQSFRRFLLSGIDTATGAGFTDHDFGQVRQLGDESVPDPDGQILTGGIFQAGDIIQVIVIEFLDHGFDQAFDFGKIHDPAAFCAWFTMYMNLDAVGMTMQPPTLMPVGNVWQRMRCLKGEFFIYFHESLLYRNAAQILTPGIQAVQIKVPVRSQWRGLRGKMR